jgi:hypothetical protein
VYVRAGSGRYYVPIGVMCDLCGVGSLDEDRAERIAEVTTFARDRVELAKQVARRRESRRAKRAAEQDTPAPSPPAGGEPRAD